MLWLSIAPYLDSQKQCELRQENKTEVAHSEQNVSKFGKLKISFDLRLCVLSSRNQNFQQKLAEFPVCQIKSTTFKYGLYCCVVFVFAKSSHFFVLLKANQLFSKDIGI